MSQAIASASKAARALDTTVGRIAEISTLPHVALKILEVANDPNSAASDLKEAMESDPALSARVVRYVNSSAYGVRSRITNLQQAIAYLGVKQIRNLAIAASVAEIFRQDDSIGEYRRSELWRHLVAVGLCARMLARRFDFENVEDMFLAGLLHDIGVILEDQHAHTTFCEMIESLADGELLCGKERQHLSFDHTMLGEKVGEIWGFPEGVRAAIRYHHMSAQYRGNDVQIVRCVEVANLIVTLKGMPSVGRNLLRFSQPAFNAMSLDRSDLLGLNAELDEELNRHSSMFHV